MEAVLNELNKDEKLNLPCFDVSKEIISEPMNSSEYTVECIIKSKYDKGDKKRWTITTKFSFYKNITKTYDTSRAGM